MDAKQQDKQTIIKLEKNLEDEKKRLKDNIEKQMTHEKKAKKAEEAAAKAAALAAATRSECSDTCKARRREVDNVRGGNSLLPRGESRPRRTRGSDSGTGSARYHAGARGRAALGAARADPLL